MQFWLCEWRFRGVRGDLAVCLPYWPRELEPVSQEEGPVLGGAVCECWAASWASAWAVLNCSRNWDPLVGPALLALGSPTSPKPLVSMLTCSAGEKEKEKVS